MLKNLFVIVVLFLFTTYSHSAGSGSNPKPEKVKTDYAKAVDAIKYAKKYEKKGKIEKAKKRYQKAQKYKNKMMVKISKLCEISKTQVNIKGKTTEKLGLIGKKKAIACEVIASVIKND